MEKERKEYLTENPRDIINECIYNLLLLIFGYDELGQLFYIQLCRTIHQMKVTSSGIHMYATRLVDYRKYLPRCLWISCYKRGQKLVEYEEMEKRELLESALPVSCLKKL